MEGERRATKVSDEAGKETRRATRLTLGVKEDLGQLGAIDGSAGALAGDLGGVDEILEGLLVLFERDILNQLLLPGEHS